MNRANNEDIEIGISGIRKLTEVIKQHYNFDLGIYASTALKRRISRVLIKNSFKNLDDLIDILGVNKSFFPIFQTQMLVEGTEFFRDPAFWRCFRDEICKIHKNNQIKIRVWLPFCSTGEEVITTAIVLHEAGIYDKSVIIATDISKEIIELSKDRVFSNSILEISENNYKRFKEDEAETLSKYYSVEATGFSFDRSLYQNIQYDVFNDSDTRNIKGVNMIICRNNFIYYSANYQETLLEIFSDKLSQNGYFAIGNKENISFCKDARKYTAINEIEKVYKKTSV
jgi:chemotaxis protein methyltransferase CheR